MKCRVCNSENLELVIDLGEQPWGNDFLPKNQIGKELFYPLRVLYCRDCHTAQLDYTVKKEVMFSNHTYLSGTTQTLSKHFKEVATYVDDCFFRCEKNKNVLDIGSNDGTQLKHYKDLGYDVLGVESSDYIAHIANQAGIPTVHKFFNLGTMKEINKKFDIINASGVFFHLEELHSVCDGIKFGLADEGIFVVQFLYMKNIIENLAFDQIYHEHLLYYTLETIETLLSQHGLTMFDAYHSPIHGGSIIGLVGHCGERVKSDRLLDMLELENEMQCNEIETYKKFAENIVEMKKQNIHFLNKAKAEGKKIYGFGAPVKGNTLLNYFQIGTDIIDVLVEKNQLRKNLYSPGMHIPIVLENEVEGQPDIYYVLAWNFKNEILKNNKKLIEEGVEFYFPVNPK